MTVSYLILIVLERNIILPRRRAHTVTAGIITFRLSGTAQESNIECSQFQRSARLAFLIRPGSGLDVTFNQEMMAIIMQAVFLAAFLIFYPWGRQKVTGE